MNREERRKDETDDGECLRCGECCMVLTLARLSDEEAALLGKNSCVDIESNPNKYEIKKVHREWEPEFAVDGVCVFLSQGEDGYTCTARNERPRICSEFQCTSERWAPKMDFLILQGYFYADKEGMKEEERKRRLEELTVYRKKAGV
ncbi:MAG: hypothetical protein GY841_15635 [FCB group bacterium]|nr:hypothetical protein [FCB group bacterium]